MCLHTHPYSLFGHSILPALIEINKLPFNVAIGRGWARIHQRSDTEAGMLPGEDVTIAMLQDLATTYAEPSPVSNSLVWTGGC
jgi:hypothetical protein